MSGSSWPEIVGERQCCRRMRGDERRAVLAAHFGSRGPQGNQLSKEEPPFQVRERRRQFKSLGRDRASGGLGEDDFILVDVADRHDARQQRGVAAERVEEDIAGEPAGAPRRQVERRGRQGQRIGGRRESGHQLVGDERAHQRRQERHRGRNREDARRAGIGTHAPAYSVRRARRKQASLPAQAGNPANAAVTAYLIARLRRR